MEYPTQPHRCSFAHSEMQLREQPDLVATQLCYQFTRKGHCKNGDTCKFAHGRSELRRLPKTTAEKPLKQEGQQESSTIPLTHGSVETSHDAPMLASIDQAFNALSLQDFREPPGLEREAPGASKPMTMSVASLQSTLRNAVEHGQDTLANLPLTLHKRVLRKSVSRETEGTDSTSSWLSGG